MTLKERTRAEDILLMQKMRDDGASFSEIGRHFDLHHTTVMHHLNAFGGSANWPWVMEPHDILTAQRLHGAQASYGEIARQLHYGKATVRRTLLSVNAQRDLDLWLQAHPLPKPPSAA